MLPKHALPQLTLNRAGTTLTRLEEQIWKRATNLDVQATTPQQEQITLETAQSRPLHPVNNRSSWGQLFDQRWCRIRLPNPSTANSWLFWKDQGEATLYIDNKPYFGFNVAHPHCQLPEGVSELWIQSSCIQSAIWHPDANGMDQGSRFTEAYLAQRNDETWHAYHDLKCLFDLAMDQRKRENPQAPDGLRGAGLQPLVDKYTPAFRILLRVMEDAVDALDGSGIEAFRQTLADGYQRLKSSDSLATCILTGHAHVDLVWIWPERMGELKAVNVFATAKHLIDRYPEFRFAYSQPASYEAVERREPELFSAVQDAIRSGSWQATGAMQVESDTIFACGEALARSFLVGQEGFTHISGAPSKLTWLPDVFGYSACLPQIMRQTGVNYFFTTKMTWNAINRFPYSSFIWRGNDGSEVLAHVTQESGYVTQMEVKHIKAPMHANQQADLHPEYLLPTGYGDGGGGATEAMLERARRMSQLPGLPEIKWDHPEAFFDRLNERRADFPIYQGECYLEYHRGTYTTHSDLKSTFRSLERALQCAESVAATTGKRWDLGHSWKRLIFSQFHDYIPGSSVWDVYIEGLPELEATGAEQINQARGALASEGSSALYNPHALPVQRWHPNDAGDPVFVELPPLSGRPIKDAICAEAPSAPTIDEQRVSNGSTEFELNDEGWIEALTWEGVTVPQQGPLGQLVLYADRPSHYEAWDIDRQALSLGTVCDAPPTITSFAKRDRAGFEVKRSIGENSTATVRFELLAGRAEIQISVSLDWQESEKLLKLHFPTDYQGTHTRCGIAYGSVLRPQQPGKMEAEAMWEIPFSRHLSVFDDGEQSGMAFLSESKYGASVRSGAVGISLVRSPRVTGFDGQLSYAWPSHLSQYKDQPIYSDLGAHTIRLAIAPYASSLPRERQPAALAETLFTPPLEYFGAPIDSVLKSITGGESLIPCWAKPAKEGGWMLRLHEVSGQRGSIQVELRTGQKCYRSNLSEQHGTNPADPQNIEFGPYEVISLWFPKN